MVEQFTIIVKVEMIADGKFKTSFKSTGESTREQYLEGLLNGMDALTRMFHERCVRLSVKI